VNISTANPLEKKVYDGITVETQKSSCKKIIIIGDKNLIRKRKIREYAT
jgi:hypothetical protein